MSGVPVYLLPLILTVFRQPATPENAIFAYAAVKPVAFAVHHGVPTPEPGYGPLLSEPPNPTFLA